MTTPAELRAALTITLGDDLGTYTFSSGQPTPAIRVDDGSDPFPEEPQVAGLECVIAPMVGTILTSLQGNAFREQSATDIWLKQFDISKTAIAYLPHVLEALTQFPTLVIEPSIVRVPRTMPLDNIETVRVRVTENLFLQV